MLDNFDMHFENYDSSVGKKHFGGPKKKEQAQKQPK